MSEVNTKGTKFQELIDRVIRTDSEERKRSNGIENVPCVPEFPGFGRRALLRLQRVEREETDLEFLLYMHRNPVTRKLVEDPKDWVWSSYSSYSGRGTPLIAIDFVA
jgi:hypothetical protein